MSEVGAGAFGGLESPLVHGGTVCYRRELPQARVLARSFLACHPGGSFTVLVLDGTRFGDGARPDDGEHGLVLWNPRMLATGSRSLESISPAHLGSEAARQAMRPWLAVTLLDLGRSPLVLADPSVFVLRPLDPLTDAAGRSGAAFVPRLIDPSVAHHNAHSTEEVLAAGVIDPGLVALADGIGARAWLTWWKSLDPGIMGGQRAFDLAPGFGHAVVRDPGTGVSRWNLHERRVLRGPDGPTAAGSPLRTLSFEGLLSPAGTRWSDDPAAPTPVYEPGEPLYELASDYLAQVAAISRCGPPA